MSQYIENTFQEVLLFKKKNFFVSRFHQIFLKENLTSLFYMFKKILFFRKKKRNKFEDEMRTLISKKIKPLRPIFTENCQGIS